MRFRTPIRPALLIASALLASATLTACESAEADPALATTEAEYVVEDAAAEQANASQETISPDLPNACDLLDAASIQGAVGQEFGEGQFNAILSSEQLAVCDWYASGDSYSTVQVQITMLDGDFSDVRAQADLDYGSTADAAIGGADDAFVAQDGTVVEFAVDGYQVSVLHYADEWIDLTDVTTALATFVAAAL